MYRSIKSVRVWRLASAVLKCRPSRIAASVTCTHLRASDSLVKVAESVGAPLRRTWTR
jgi:hypothetical protein